MGLENVKNPLLAFCVSRSIFSDGSVCTRIERRSADKTRPIKISVTNSNNVHEILLKSKKLRRSQHHKTVLISPDRSPEEQARQHLLVLEMKEKAKKDLKKRYYIRSGIICCKDKISE